MTEFSKSSSLEIAQSLETPLNEQGTLQRSLAISGSVRFLVTSLLQQFQPRQPLSEHSREAYNLDLSTVLDAISFASFAWGQTP